MENIEEINEELRLTLEEIEKVFAKAPKSAKNSEKRQKFMYKIAIMDTGGHEELENFLKNTKDGYILRQLSELDDYHLREYVAENPHTPIDVIDKLAKDMADWVKIAATNNPSISLRTIKYVIRYSKCSDAVDNAKRALKNRSL